MKKIILSGAIIFLVAVVLAAVVVSFFPGRAVKKTLEVVGPEVAKVDFRLKEVNLSVWSGKGELRGLVVGNPEGFKTRSAINLGSVSLALKPSSLLSEKIIIRSIHVHAPEVTFEGGLRGSNLSKVLDNIEAATNGQEVRTEGTDEKAGRKIQVDELVITGGRINLSMTALQGKSAPVPLPDIHLTGLGKGPDGITARELLKHFLKTMLQKTVSTVGGALGDITKGLSETAKDAAKTTLENAGKATKGVLDLLKRKKP
ncbi:MAG: AsmA family protein [Verrucomicrobia bacterium]|nr:AsmA family protein [Verrucomicrobiota bacterium]